MCDALPGFHAFTGLDYTAAFNNKGKIKPFKIMEGNEEFQNAFASFGLRESIHCDTLKVIEKFVCALYGQPKQIADVSSARFNCFVKSYKVKKDLLNSIKGCDPSLIPLSFQVLLQKVKRANMVSSILKSAHLVKPLISLNPEENGWYLDKGEYFLYWADGDINPPLDKLTLTTDSDDIDDNLYQSESDSDINDVDDNY